MAVSARTVLVTRMGVGIFDPVWWSTRLGLFRTVTAASVSRFAGRDFVWAVVLDADIPRRILNDVYEIFESVGIIDQVQFTFVPDHSRLGESVRYAIRSAVDPRQPVHAQLLDDDDAISPRLHDAHLEAFDPRTTGPQAASTPIGMAIDAPRLRRGVLNYVSHVPSTSFYGDAEDVASLMLSSHRKWMDTAPKRGGLAHRVPTDTMDWLYLYHRQGDGDYEARIDALGDTLRPLDQSDLDPFGIDLSELATSVRAHEETPDTMGLTWRRTQPQQYALLDLKNRTSALKKQCIEINTDIFGGTRPFFYVKSPLPGKRAKAGRINFNGVGLPDTRIELWIKGTREFRKMGETTCAASDGTWSIPQNFKAAAWTVSLRQFDGEEQTNNLDFALRVV